MKRIHQKFIQKKTTKKDVIDQVKKLRMDLKRSNPKSFQALEQQAQIFHENQSKPSETPTATDDNIHAGEEKIDPQKNISTVLKMLEQSQYSEKSPQFKAEVFKIIQDKAKK